MDDQAPLHDEPAPRTDTGPDPARLRRLQLRRQVFLALGLLLCYGFFLQQPAWNEYSRYDLIRAVVEEGTVRIDSFEGNTGDKAFKDGHYYSDKAPGTAIRGVPVYAAYLGLNRLAGIEEPPQEAAVAFLSFVISGLTTALLEDGDDKSEPHETEVPNLSVVTSGPHRYAGAAPWRRSRRRSAPAPA
jgi:hypothetical protein